MGGLLVLALIAGYIWLATKLIKNTQPYWKKALLALAAILIPTADAVYGRIKLKQMCEAEGGLHIYRVVEGVDGYDYPGMSPNDEWLIKYGYRFIEGDQSNGKRTRLSIQPDGKILREVGVTPIAKYVYELDQGEPRDTFSRTESRVVVKDSGEVLGRIVRISYAGGWLERFISSLYAARGNAGRCDSRSQKAELVTKTLVPIK